MERWWRYNGDIMEAGEKKAGKRQGEGRTGRRKIWVYDPLTGVKSWITRARQPGPEAKYEGYTLTLDRHAAEYVDRVLCE
jgi:hypothetical protein